jgi:hypothetical protein
MGRYTPQVTSPVPITVEPGGVTHMQKALQLDQGLLELVVNSVSGYVDPEPSWLFELEGGVNCSDPDRPDVAVVSGAACGPLGATCVAVPLVEVSTAASDDSTVEPFSPGGVNS